MKEEPTPTELDKDQHPEQEKIQKLLNAFEDVEIPDETLEPVDLTEPLDIGYHDSFTEQEEPEPFNQVDQTEPMDITVNKEDSSEPLEPSNSLEQVVSPEPTKEYKPPIILKVLFILAISGVLAGVVFLGVSVFYGSLKIGDVQKEVEKHYNTKLASITRTNTSFLDAMWSGTNYKVKTKEGISFKVKTVKKYHIKEEIHYHDTYLQQLKQKEIRTKVNSLQEELRNNRMYLDVDNPTTITAELSDKENEVTSYTGNIYIQYRMDATNINDGVISISGIDYTAMSSALDSIKFLEPTLTVNLELLYPYNDEDITKLQEQGREVILDNQFVKATTIKLDPATLSSISSGKDLKPLITSQLEVK